MKKHPNKDIRKAIEFAIESGWTIKYSSGHSWGEIYCPYNDSQCRCGQNCITRICSTPRNNYNHAKQIVRAVKGCIYYEEEN